MSRFEVFIPAALESEFNVTLKVEASNWMAALKSGLARLGDQGTQVTNILVDIMEDNSIHVTESVSGRVFRIKELAEGAAAAAPSEQPKPVPPPPAKAAEPAAPMPPRPAPKSEEKPAPKVAEKPAPKIEAKPLPETATPVAPQPRAQWKREPAASKAAEPAATPATPAPAPKPAVKAPAAPPPLAKSAASAAAKPAPAPEAETPRVEQVASPSEPVTGSIGRTRERGRVEDLLNSLFERVSEIESLDPDKALSFLLDLAMEAIPTDAGSVFLADVSNPELSLACARGPKAKELEAMKLRMPMGIGIVGFCAQEAVSLAISDTEKDPRFHREVSQKIGYPTRSILCAPMVVSGRTFGCIEIINKKGSSHFSDSELSALAYLAHQGARYLESR